MTAARSRGARLVLVLPEGPVLCPGAGPVQIVTTSRGHVAGPPPKLTASSITPISAATVSSHSSSAGGRQPRRWHALRNLACHRARRSRRRARRDPTCIFRSGIPASDAIRLKADRSAASSGSDPASLSWIEFRACCSHALRLIAGSSAALPRIKAWRHNGQPGLRDFERPCGNEIRHRSLHLNGRRVRRRLAEAINP